MDESGQEYVPMTHDEATEKHPGGIEDTSSVEKGPECYYRCCEHGFSSFLAQHCAAVCQVPTTSFEQFVFQLPN